MASNQGQSSYVAYLWIFFLAVGSVPGVVSNVELTSIPSTIEQTCPGETIEFTCITESSILSWTSDEYIGVGSPLEFLSINTIGTTRNSTTNVNTIANLTDINGGILTSTLRVVTSRSSTITCINVDDRMTAILLVLIGAVPGAPQNVTAVGSMDDCMIQVTWDPPADIGGSDYTYRVGVPSRNITANTNSSTESTLHVPNCADDIPIQVYAVNRFDCMRSAETLLRLQSGSTITAPSGFSAQVVGGIVGGVFAIFVVIGIIIVITISIVIWRIARKVNKQELKQKYKVSNPHLSFEKDFLYHIGYDGHRCREDFKDVKFVVAGGSVSLMSSFAELIAKELGHPQVTKKELSIAKTDRFAFYKIGPVLSISHGMGVPSITIMLHEIIKLLHYAGAEDAVIIRIGTSGGIAVDPGTVVVTNKAFNGFLKEEHEVVILGERKTRPTKMDQGVAEAILSCQDDTSFKTVLGGTMCTDDFYEGQGRVNGAICEHTEQQTMDYLHQLKGKGIVNIEMECTAISSICYRTNVKCAVVCVTLPDRLKGDQMTFKFTPEDYKAWSLRPQQLVARFIKSELTKTES